MTSPIIMPVLAQRAQWEWTATFLARRGDPRGPMLSQLLGLVEGDDVPLAIRAICLQETRATPYTAEERLEQAQAAVQLMREVGEPTTVHWYPFAPARPSAGQKMDTRASCAYTFAPDGTLIASRTPESTWHLPARDMPKQAQAVPWQRSGPT